MPGRSNNLYDIATEYRDCVVDALLSYKLYLDIQFETDRPEPEEGFFVKRQLEINSVLNILDHKGD